jgi:hypothetical protein
MEHRVEASGLLYTTPGGLRVRDDPTPAWSPVKAILCDSRGMN